MSVTGLAGTAPPWRRPFAGRAAWVQHEHTSAFPHPWGGAYVPPRAPYACSTCACCDPAAMKIFKCGTWFALHSPMAECVDTTVCAFCVAHNLEIKGFLASWASFPCLDVTVSLWSVGASWSLRSVKYFGPPAARQMGELVVFLPLKAESRQPRLAEALEQRAVVRHGVRWGWHSHSGQFRKIKGKRVFWYALAIADYLVIK